MKVVQYDIMLTSFFHTYTNIPLCIYYSPQVGRDLMLKLLKVTIKKSYTLALKIRLRPQQVILIVNFDFASYLLFVLSSATQMICHPMSKYLMWQLEKNIR